MRQSLSGYQQILLILFALSGFPSFHPDFSNQSQANSEASHAYSMLVEIYHSPRPVRSPLL